MEYTVKLILFTSWRVCDCVFVSDKSQMESPNQTVNYVNFSTLYSELSGHVEKSFPILAAGIQRCFAGKN